MTLYLCLNPFMDTSWIQLSVLYVVLRMMSLFWTCSLIVIVLIWFTLFLLDSLNLFDIVVMDQYVDILLPLHLLQLRSPRFDLQLLLFLLSWQHFHQVRCFYSWFILGKLQHFNFVRKIFNHLLQFLLSRYHSIIRVLFLKIFVNSESP